MSGGGRPIDDATLRRRVSELVMGTVVVLHWAAHLIEERDPVLGRWLRNKANALSDVAKHLRRNQ